MVRIGEYVEPILSGILNGLHDVLPNSGNTCNQALSLMKNVLLLLRMLGSGLKVIPFPTMD